MAGTRGGYPHGALTEAPEPAPVTADRVDRRSRAKRRIPLWLLLIPVAIVALAVVLIVVLRGDEGGGIPFIGGGEDNTVPEFEFRVAHRTAVVATSAETDVDALESVAERTGTEVAPIMDELYTAAFLDPSNWRDGEYEEVFAHFAGGAVAAAQESVETLTPGVGAGDVFETITPTRGSLSFRVLFDPEGNPDTVVVRVRFRALGERKDGTYLAIVSNGQFFLQDADGWKVTAFDVERGDKDAKPPPSPSPSESPSA